MITLMGNEAAESYELGIIGAGNMAEAITRGVLASGIFRADQLVAADVAPARRKLFERELNVHAVERPAEAARGASRLLLSVKPQQMGAVLGEIGGVLPANALVISIAAGVGTAFIESALGQGNNWRVVRTMPNTPMLVGQGMVAVAAGRNATADDLADVTRIFAAAASVISVDENKLDAVTAMSGSGPAYFFFLVEQMVRAGVELGLTVEQSRVLAAKTALGAATMLASSTDSPRELRRKVTSPGGTTQAAISHMESAGVDGSIVQAIKAAHRRSRELGV
jgi:pyrroline-5-carboxylate reductase